MKTYFKIIISVLTLLFLTSCGIYSFTGGNTGDAKTIQVDFFRNEAPLAPPSLSQQFTQELQDLFTRQTNLTFVDVGGDLHFEGEIVGYRIAPLSALSSGRAAQNQLTVTVNVRFSNKLNEKDDFERQFSFSQNFDAAQNPEGAILEGMLETIFSRINQDIFSASVAKW